MIRSHISLLWSSWFSSSFEDSLSFSIHSWPILSTAHLQLWSVFSPRITIIITYHLPHTQIAIHIFWLDVYAVLILCFVWLINHVAIIIIHFNNSYHKIKSVTVILLSTFFYFYHLIHPFLWNLKLYPLKECVFTCLNLWSTWWKYYF